MSVFQAHNWYMYSLSNVAIGAPESSQSCLVQPTCDLMVFYNSDQIRAIVDAHGGQIGRSNGDESTADLYVKSLKVILLL